MEKKALYKPRDLVRTFTGQVGLVISEETVGKIKGHIKQGRRPGHFFAPGCCENIDYVLQVPVLFEDGTYDIMKAMNIKSVEEDEEEKKPKLEAMLREIEEK